MNPVAAVLGYGSWLPVVVVLMGVLLAVHAWMGVCWRSFVEAQVAPLCYQMTMGEEVNGVVLVTDILAQSCKFRGDGGGSEVRTHYSSQYCRSSITGKG
jgi:hypothetical protein